MEPKEDCIFCKIIAKQVPAEFLYEDDNTVVIKTIAPVAEGHSLVIPKKHAETIFDIDQESLGKIIHVAKEMSIQLQERYQATGINLLHASGRDAEQSVFHFHMHIVPRHAEDGLDLWGKKGL